MKGQLQKILFALALFSASHALHSEELDIPLHLDAPEAWLVTYAPGELYWQRFGHNAIWLRDRSRGIDHVFNFGFFDFNQENFFTRFIQGRMLYFSAARPAEEEFRQYQFENREIVAQLLDLEMLEYERLANHLLWSVRRENRDYLYDYYRDNCSTRVRDAIDLALNGSLQAVSTNQPAAQNLRAHTRRSVAGDFAYYLGLQLALALPVDRDISRWDEMFLPAIVTQSLVQLSRDDRPLVKAEHVVFKGSSYVPPGTPPVTWWRYLLAGALLSGLFMLLGRLAGTVFGQASLNAWLMIAASGGFLLLYLWFLTNHHAAGPNVNLLLLNPLFLLGLHRSMRRMTLVLLLGGLVLAGLLSVLPGSQYNLDVLAFIAPLNLTGAAWLWRHSTR